MVEYENLIQKAISNVPQYLRDDCYQAACLGLVIAQNRREKYAVKYFRSYAYKCMREQVIKEVAKIHGPGNGLISLDHNTFLALAKYKKDEDTISLTSKTKKCYDSLVSAKRLPIEHMRDEWND